MRENYMKKKEMKEIKKTVGMAVRPKFKDNLLKFKPKKMTQTLYFEMCATWLYENKDKFVPEIARFSNINLKETKAIEDKKAYAEYLAKLKSNEIMYAPEVVSA
jgi:hypothetical protein|tara:strand:- start:875 stop:1186 length:312 start_codon:yes stop_codon:yes gene_type:complete